MQIHNDVNRFLGPANSCSKARNCKRPDMILDRSEPHLIPSSRPPVLANQVAVIFRFSSSREQLLSKFEKFSSAPPFDLETCGGNEASPDPADPARRSVNAISTPVFSRLRVILAPSIRSLAFPVKSFPCPLVWSASIDSGSRERREAGERGEMDPDAVKSTLSNLAFGNVMAAAARDYQKVRFFFFFELFSIWVRFLLLFCSRNFLGMSRFSVLCFEFAESCEICNDCLLLLLGLLLFNIVAVEIGFDCAATRIMS